MNSDFSLLTEDQIRDLQEQEMELHMTNAKAGIIEAQLRIMDARIAMIGRREKLLELREKSEA